MIYKKYVFERELHDMIVPCSRNTYQYSLLFISRIHVQTADFLPSVLLDCHSKCHVCTGSLESQCSSCSVGNYLDGTTCKGKSTCHR